jgi:hypothetical protein
VLFQTVAIPAFQGVVTLRANRARHDFKRGGPRFRSQHAFKDLSGVSAVFGAISGVDLVIDLVVGLDECGVLLNAACPNPTFMRLLDAAEPISVSSSNGSNVKIVAAADDPHGYRFSLRAVTPDGRDLHFFGSSNFVEFAGGPLRHRPVSFEPIHIRALIARRSSMALYASAT